MIKGTSLEKARAEGALEAIARLHRIIEAEEGALKDRLILLNAPLVLGEKQDAEVKTC